MVEPTPALNDEMITSSNDSVNARTAPAAMPGAASGRTTRRNVCRGVAEIGRSLFEPLVEVGQPAFTTTITKEMQNVMWAMISVRKPS